MSRFNQFEMLQPTGKFWWEPLTNETLSEQLYDYRLGLQNKNTFSPVAVSLSPWVISATLFEKAVSSAASLSHLLQLVSADTSYLSQALSDFTDRASLLFYLKESLELDSSRLATGLNISRHDFLLDTAGEWRLVESNAIAAGMGPFSEQLGHLLNNYLTPGPHKMAPNPATLSLAQQLYQAAYENIDRNKTETGSPLIVFVVPPIEDNIHDQNRIAEAIVQLGGRVIRQTFAQLADSLQSQDHRLQLKGLGLVDCFYFRTGYNLDQYHAENEERKYLKLRKWIEQHKVVVAPAINQQLSASKWIQAKLSQMRSIELQQRFQLSTFEAERISEALKTRFVFPKRETEITSKLSSGGWILKSQNEGGGNVFDKPFHLSTKDLTEQQWLLMEKIPVSVREEPVSVFKENQICQFSKTVSELGIFTLGEQHQYGGYLLRSKPQGQLETGVHQAGGFLDSIRLRD